MSIPRNVRAAANELAQECLPGHSACTKHLNPQIVRAWIRDAYLAGWERKETEQAQPNTCQPR